MISVVPLKECCMKIDSAITDLYEICEDTDLTPEGKVEFQEICESVCLLEARLLNLVKKECGIDEDEFLNTTIPMDPIDSFPGDGDGELEDILNAAIED